MAFYNELRKETQRQLEFSINTYNREVDKVKALSEQLHNLRSKECREIIELVEVFINDMANTPKEFDKEFADYKIKIQEFDILIEEFKKESFKAEAIAGAQISGGVATGAGVAALMPSAAIAIATTFGTASTGTAIASLSGAAATNAALAWLGGGAIAAGGGGIAAGNAFLALAGPIGWSIGAAGLIGGGLILTHKNKNIAKKAGEAIAQIETNTKTMDISLNEIRKLLKLTNKHVVGVKTLLSKLQKSAPKDYLDYSDSQKETLGALVNHINSLSKLQVKSINQ